jgi:hypothetical protein
VQAGSSSVLAQLQQQHGLRLLQALAAPVQQLQLRINQGDEKDVYVTYANKDVGALPQQLLTLKAPASGMHAPTCNDNTSEYELRALGCMSH